tara:strand:- start:1769 stop:1984 length:216 start_codon:yes stop_codon:yes gene_type:complete
MVDIVIIKIRNIPDHIPLQLPEYTVLSGMTTLRSMINIRLAEEASKDNLCIIMSSLKSKNRKISAFPPITL